MPEINSSPVRDVQNSDQFLTRDNSGDLVRVNASSVIGPINIVNHETVDTAILDTNLEPNYQVNTRGRLSNGDAGYGTYVVKSAAQATADGDIIDELGSAFTMSNGNILVLQDSPAYIEQWGVIAEGVDHLAAARAAFNSRRTLRARSFNKRWNLSDVIRTDDISIDVDLNSNTLVSVGENERVILAINSFNPVNTITGFTSSQGRVTIQLDSTPLACEPNGVLKIYSDEIINPYANKPNERIAEYMIIDSVDSQANTVTCRGALIFDHSDNPRCASMRTENTFSLKNLTIDRELPHTVGEYAVGIDVEGYAYGQWENIRAIYFTGQLCSNRSGYNHVFRDIYAEELLDASTDNALGYVGFDFGSQGSQWYNLSGGKVRHTYTTGAADIQPGHTDPADYGGAVRCHVWTGTTTASTNFAYDMHEDSYECEIHHVVVYDAQTTTPASSGGFQDRGLFTRLHSMTYQSDGADISAAGRAVFLSTGSYNFNCNRLIYRGASGRCFQTFQTALRGTVQRARIDQIVYEPIKSLNNLIVLEEEFGLEVGRIDVYPSTIDRTFYGSGDAMVKLSNDSSFVVTDSINLWFDRPDFPNLAGSSSTIVRADGDIERIRYKLNVHCTANTWNYVGANINPIKGDSALVTPPTVNYAHVDVNVYYDEFPVGGSERPDRPIISDLNTASDMTYTFKVIKNGREYLSTDFRRDNLFSAGSELGFGPDEFFITDPAAQGDKSHRNFTGVFECQSGAVTITAVEPPSFEGQVFTLCMSAFNSTPGNPVFDAPLLQTATGVRLDSDIILTPGSVSTFVSRTVDGVIAWELCQGTPSDAREDIQISGTVNQGVVTLNRDWDDFEQIIIEYSNSPLGTPVAGDQTFTVSRISPSDSTTVFNYVIEVASGTIDINFRDTNRDEIYINGIGVTADVTRIYGRYRRA